MSWADLYTSPRPVGRLGGLYAHGEDVLGADGCAGCVALAAGVRNIEHLGSAHNEWDRRTVDQVIARVQVDDTDAATNASHAGTLTFARDSLPVDLAVRARARGDPSVATGLRRVDNARIGYLRSQCAEITPDRGSIARGERCGSV